MKRITIFLMLTVFLVMTSCDFLSKPKVDQQSETNGSRESEFVNDLLEDCDCEALKDFILLNMEWFIRDGRMTPRNKLSIEDIEFRAEKKGLELSVSFSKNELSVFEKSISYAPDSSYADEIMEIVRICHKERKSSSLVGDSTEPKEGPSEEIEDERGDKKEGSDVVNKPVDTGDSKIPVGDFSSPIRVFTAQADTVVVLKPADYGVDKINVTVNGTKQTPMHGGEYFVRLGANEKIAIYR